jgi:hypothetical protein
VLADGGIPPEADRDALRAVVTIQVTVLIERAPEDDGAGP